MTCRETKEMTHPPERIILISVFFSRWTHQSWDTSWSSCGRLWGSRHSLPRMSGWTWWSCSHGNSSSARASAEQRCRRAGRATSWSSWPLCSDHKRARRPLWGEMIRLTEGLPVISNYNRFNYLTYWPIRHIYLYVYKHMHIYWKKYI